MTALRRMKIAGIVFPLACGAWITVDCLLYGGFVQAAPVMSLMLVLSTLALVTGPK